MLCNVICEDRFRQSLNLLMLTTNDEDRLEVLARNLVCFHIMLSLLDDNGQEMLIRAFIAE